MILFDFQELQNNAHLIHTYIMQGKTKIRADDLLAIFCVDYTVPVVVIHEDATEFAHAMMIEKAKVKKKKR